METFVLNDYYSFKADLNGYMKQYTARIIGIDGTHIACIDASGDEVILNKASIAGEAKRITQDKFEETREKIARKKEARTPKDDDDYVPSTYRP
jgi:hypothetical protein